MMLMNTDLREGTCLLVVELWCVVLNYLVCV
jgi:hypothetical protein